jgi:glycosyltransferase involved in cell wall biosynthesis
MRKKIVFVLGGMSFGGPQKSLINLLNQIDFKLFDITVLLFKKGGVLLNELPSSVKIKYVRPIGLFNNYTDGRLSFIVWFPIRAFLKIVGEMLIRLFNYKSQIKWSLVEFFIRKETIYYDMAIAYSEGRNIYYVANKLDARIKIGRIPTDYESAKLNAKFDKKYFVNMNYLFVVSSSNGIILSKIFPGLSNRIMVFESIISPDQVHKMALQGTGFNDDWKGVRLFTMARIDRTKGIDLVIETCEKLIGLGVEFKWYFMGSGKIQKYKELIEMKNLSNNLVLCEPKINPIPFLAQCDIYIQPSLYEGKSNAVNEAKAMYKPIIITNFSTSKDHIEDGVNGLISESNSTSLSVTIEKLINDKILMKKLSERLKNNFVGNTNEIEKLYILFET